MKHAYLILAHNEFEVLSKLVEALDDKRNDIYIHFDSKVKDLPSVVTHKSHLYILENRYKIYWGDFSIVKAEIELFKTAINNGEYSYYHLISGVDYPLKSQDYIHEFFIKNNGKQFIGYAAGDLTSMLERRVNKWHIFPHYFSKSTKDFIIRRIIRSLFIKLQYFIGYKRNKNIEFKKGTQWVSITNDLVRQIIENEHEINSIYTHSFCPDEIFIQTICWNSEYRNNIYNPNDEGLGCLRAIKWVDGELLDWTIDEIDSLLNNSYIFARKFSKNQISAIERILENISI